MCEQNSLHLIDSNTQDIAGKHINNHVNLDTNETEHRTEETQSQTLGAVVFSLHVRAPDSHVGDRGSRPAQSGASRTHVKGLHKHCLQSHGLLRQQGNKSVA